MGKLGIPDTLAGHGMRSIPLETTWADTAGMGWSLFRQLQGKGRDWSFLRRCPIGQIFLGKILDLRFFHHHGVPVSLQAGSWGGRTAIMTKTSCWMCRDCKDCTGLIRHKRFTFGRFRKLHLGCIQPRKNHGTKLSKLSKPQPLPYNHF